MADATISFKTDELIREKVQELIKNSGGTGKEWFQKAVALAEAQNLKQEASDYASDLTELEVHTARIYELVASMMQKSMYLKEHAVKELSEQLNRQRETTIHYQTKLQELTAERDSANHALAEARQEQAEALQQVAELREALETNKLLVAEYKEKNDVLNGIVAKSQHFAENNEVLRESLAESQRARQKAESEIDSLRDALQALSERHNADMEQSNARWEIERQRAILEAQRAYQDELHQTNARHTTEVKALLDQMAQERKEAEQRIQQLQAEAKPSRKATTTKKPPTP